MSSAVHALPLKPVSQPQPSPRLWPAIALVGLYWLVWLVMNMAFQGTMQQFMSNFWSPVVMALGFLIWYLGLSRLPWISRGWGLGWIVLAAALSLALSHKSMAFAALMAALPAGLTAVTIWLVATRGATTLFGWLGLAAVALLTWGYFDLLRLDGISGALIAERSWRWTETPEERYLRLRETSVAKNTVAKNAGAKDAASSAPGAMPAPVASDTTTPAATAPTMLVAVETDWPQFRGPTREGLLHNAAIAEHLAKADWKAAPPRRVWQRAIGPGWSSFAVIGERAFTQEQRGEKEAVFCFDVNTGEELWSHEDTTRFEDIKTHVSGDGPRATPTFHAGKLYTLGGSGILNCLDAATGKHLWHQDIRKDGQTEPPLWGFSSSPLVAQGVVTVFAGNDKAAEGGKPKDVATDKKEKTAAPAAPRMLAYDAESGQLKWTGSQGVHSYSSPQLAKLGGQEQVLMITDHGLEAFDPADGKLLWDHKWYLQGMFRVCQPQTVGDEQVLLPTPMSGGTRLISVRKSGEGWTVDEKWTSTQLTPYFNDFVLQNGHLYGFDGTIFACVDVATGKRLWKKGRYGSGQVLMVGDAGVAIIIAESGEAVLATVSPEGIVERGRFPALTGKTWNHPVVTAGGKLLVRNSEQMACYDLLPLP